MLFIYIVLSQSRYALVHFLFVNNSLSPADKPLTTLRLHKGLQSDLKKILLNSMKNFKESATVKPKLVMFT